MREKFTEHTELLEQTRMNTGLERVFKMEHLFQVCQVWIFRLPETENLHKFKGICYNLGNKNKVEAMTSTTRTKQAGSVWIVKMLERVKLRALLTGWAKWKRGGDLGKQDYLSPPNMIYRLMAGDVFGGGGFGSVEPRGLASAATDKHNAVYHRLDCVIGELPPRRRQAIQCEFLAAGQQKDKAAAMGISIDGYKRNLNFAVEQILADDFIQNLVQAA